MQRYISEAEDILESKLAQHTERKVMKVHQRLDAFEQRILVLQSPKMDVMSLHAAMESVPVDLDTILDARGLKSETPSAEPAMDTVLAAFFSTATVPPPPP